MWPGVEEVVCYPYSPLYDRECRERVSSLYSLGIERILDTGPVEIGGRRVLGKGHSAVVVAAVHRVYGTVALKIRRMDSKRGSLEHEAQYLIHLRPTGCVPEVYLYSRDFIVREYIRGPLLGEYIESSYRDRASLERLARALLETAYKIDSMYIDIEEISRADRQVVLREGDPSRPYYIDLESARRSERPSNLTRVLGYLYRRGVLGILGLRDTERVFTLARTYRRGGPETRRSVLEEVLGLLGQGSSGPQ